MSLKDIVASAMIGLASLMPVVSSASEQNVAHVSEQVQTVESGRFYFVARGAAFSLGRGENPLQARKEFVFGSLESLDYE